MKQERPSECPGKLRRYCIPDHASDRPAVAPLPNRPELVVRRKTLQQRSLTEGNGAILLGMSEPTVAKSRAERRHGRSWLVPPHSAVNGVVGLSGATAMTRKHQVLRPFLP